MHTYPYFMLPSSVLKSVSKAHQVVTESGDRDSEEDHPLTKQELESDNVIMDVSFEVKRLVKGELDYWQKWYEQQINEEPSVFKEEWKVGFLQEIHAKSDYTKETIYFCRRHELLKL